ncbi:RloB family protein [Candidatus Electrothrix sp.]|uniref:RloB family protein n=1 Tax=Candidatus Electrothrix sp. TaxID=2170559 RepID=UPI004055CB1E
MARKVRRFVRRTGRRSYRKLFLIAAEGAKTEPQYFSLFNSRDATVRVNCLKCGHDSAPPQVLKRMTTWLKKNSLKDSDEAWLVVDKDQWTDAQLRELLTWSQTKKNYGFALSNPKFEYWLLLHFEDGKSIDTSRKCSERLRQYLKNYDKGIDLRKFTWDSISKAVHQAKLRDTPPCKDWPKNTGTTVYRLVEKFILSEAGCR